MDDVTQHSNKQLSTILRNPSHPMHSAAKAERDRRMAKREDNDLDEISIKDLTKNIAKSTGTKNLQKALKKSKDQTKMDLAALRKKLQTEKTLTPAEIKKREEIAKAMERDNPDMPMAKKMAIATATAKKVAEDVELQEGVIDQVKDIAAKKQAKKINGVMVDMFTASAISKVYDAVNDANKAKMEKLPITKLADLAMKMMKRESVELDENRVDALAKDFHNRLKKAGNSDRNQNRERMATLAKAKKQGLSPIEMKQLDGKMNAVMNKMDGLAEAVNVKGIQKAVDDGKSMDAIMTMFANKRTTNTDEIRKVVKDYMWKKRMKKEEVELDEISAKKYHAALKGREYKRDRARNSAAANQFVGKDAEAQADMAKSKDHDRKLKKMKQMGINRTARNLGEKAPKIDDAKYAAHMDKLKKPKKMSSTQKALADIRKRAEK